jgi:type II secretory pathway component PulF
METEQTVISYSVKASHTTQHYRLEKGNLIYSNEKNDLETTIPLATIKTQKSGRYVDQYFWWGLIATMLGVVYFAQIATRQPLVWNAKHIPFGIAIIVGLIQAAYWAQFPRTWKVITEKGTVLSIMIDSKDPERSMQFIEALKAATSKGV